MDASSPLARDLLHTRTAAALSCFHCPARTSDLCGSLPDHQLDALFTLSQRITLKPRQTLILEGDPSDLVYNVSAGTMMLSRVGADGRRQILSFLFRGNFIGLTANGHYRYNAEAVTEVELCRFDRAKLHELFREHPEMERAFRALALKTLEASQDLIYTLGRRSAVERVASFLLYLSEQHRILGACSPVIPLPMTRTDIADYLGLTIETVSRAFTKLKTDRLIRLKTAHSFEIVSHRALSDLAAAE